LRQNVGVRLTGSDQLEIWAVTDQQAVDMDYVDVYLQSLWLFSGTRVWDYFLSEKALGIDRPSP
jgi:hypothetical protein